MPVSHTFTIREVAHALTTQQALPAGIPCLDFPLKGTRHTGSEPTVGPHSNLIMPIKSCSKVLGVRMPTNLGENTVQSTTVHSLDPESMPFPCAKCIHPTSPSIITASTLNPKSHPIIIRAKRHVSSGEPDHLGRWGRRSVPAASAEGAIMPCPTLPDGRSVTV